jgi:hypothetical protein
VDELDALRRASVNVDHRINGVETLLRSAAAVDAGDALLLNSAAAPSFEWAVYSFSVGANPLVKVSFDTAALNGRFFVGVADYARGRWSFSGPFEGNGKQTVNLFAGGATSPGGNFYCAAVAAGQQSTVSTVTLTVNETPQPVTALLNIEPGADVQRNDIITLDGSASSSSNGAIVQYELDLDNNGVFELDRGNDPTFELKVLQAGQFTYALRVTDELGAKAVDEAVLNVHGFNNPISPDDGTVGRWPSLAVIAGRPAIAYYDAEDSQLLYVRANDPQGKSWGSPLSLDAISHSSVTGARINLLEVAGRPAVGYYDETTARLWFVRALDAEGASWGDPVAADNGGQAGEYCSLAIVEGNPAFSYYSAGSDSLRYIRSDNSEGTVWGFAREVDDPPAANTGLFTSMQVVNGRPAIVYQDLTLRALRFVRANDALGNSWGSPQSIDTPGAQGIMGLYNCLAIVDGFPAVSYHNDDIDIDEDDAHGQLRYRRALDADGSAWGAAQVLDSDVDTGEDSSLKVINGLPTISYFDQSVFDLRLVQGLDAAGADWTLPKTVDETGQTGETTSLAAVDGGLAVAYRHLENGDLLYVWGF